VWVCALRSIISNLKDALMNSISIAVLLTCYNRRPKTLASLAAFFNQSLPPEIQTRVYLVDDNSTDGTAEAVRQAYPQVKILLGNGNLFWNGGMRLAFEEALKSDYDYYLWLNDDTILDPEALNKLLTTHHNLADGGSDRALIVGATRDPETGKTTYGGMIRRSKLRPLKFDLIEPGEQPKSCDTINGNCVLIPRTVAQSLGNLDPAFTHYIGDFDYGLRARQQGCTVWLAPGYIGTCSGNPQPDSSQKSQVHLNEQLKKMEQPKGLAIQQEVLYSFEEWKVFSQRHGGVLWLVYWLLPYRRLLWNSLLGKR
jgi:GT2 family glycosyltransferase